MYYETGVAPPPQEPRTSQLSNNLSELDQLLQDLNSAQFMAEVDKRNTGRYSCYLTYLGVHNILVHFLYSKEWTVKHGHNKHAFKEFSLTAKFMPMMTFLLSLKMYYKMKKINIVDKETEYHVKSLTHV